MSRLQVGGLALIVGYETSTRNLYKTVRLEEYLGFVKFDDDSTWDDCWIISGDGLVASYFTATEALYTRAKWLKPLGDKQTQDELSKELELVDAN